METMKRGAYCVVVVASKGKTEKWIEIGKVIIKRMGEKESEIDRHSKRLRIAVRERERERIAVRERERVGVGDRNSKE